MKFKTIILGTLLLALSMNNIMAIGDKIPEQLLTSTSWNEQETKNVKLVSSFVTDLMINHDADKVVKKYGNSSYIQHNRNIPDGMVGIARYVEEFAKEYPDFTYDVKRIIADGDLVIFHSHATLNKEDRGNDKKGLNITDIWKIKDGKIVEHWDSIQAMDFSMRLFNLMQGGKIRNSNGVY
ncbi:MAG: polyketide cyclase [Oligoflexia bacterium]|nr:polyketide cyclase [Oligoflexia bacterium]